MHFYKYLKKKWDNLDKGKKDKFLFLLNYILNGIPLSVMIYFITSIWLSHSWYRVIGTYISVTVFLIYFEHYYVWLKTDWDTKE
jgi:hypothetical protein